jgi:tRNA(Arg) A34 adenosine deaminase TadA
MKLRWFEAAKAAARKSPSDPQMGAAIVKGSKLLSIGFNQRDKTHPRARNYSNCIHAELHAVLGLSHKDLKDADIYIYRELKSGVLAMAKPCPFCWSLLKTVGIRRVYYTTNGSYSKEKVK